MKQLSTLLPRSLTSQHSISSISGVPRIIKVVSLDAMNTIVKLKEPPHFVYSRFARIYGLDVNPNAMSFAFSEQMKLLSITHPCFGFNSIGSFEWWKRVIIGSLEKASSSSISVSCGDALSRDLYRYYEEVDAWGYVDINIKEALTSLKMKGIVLVVLSNFDTRLKTILSHMKLSSLFDLVILSGEVGIEKPDPNIFNIIVRRFGLDNKSDLLHIGDDVIKDFEGAQSYGAQAILFDPLNKHCRIASTNRISSFSQLII
uniref:Haloacid dehalogenase-like hydrolase domain-containing protein 3 n=1 Tax=Heterorhabditis bacteriophora TaxID=37862 RepID=A0A1I7XTI0_HETBA